jgi:hypothetical protein
MPCQMCGCQRLLHSSVSVLFVEPLIQAIQLTILAIVAEGGASASFVNKSERI